MIKFSRFDSQLFNRKVGKLTLKIQAKNQILHVQGMVKKANYDLILVTLEDDKCLAVNSFIEQGFHLSQVKVELSLPLSQFDKIKKYDVKGFAVKQDAYRMKDKACLNGLALELSKNSRFSNKIFPKDISQELYTQWLENSLAKKVSDRNYFLIDTQRDKIIGLTTIKFKGYQSEIGFMVIDPLYRGKGLGKHLLSEAIKDLSINHIVTISLKTELSNSRALNFYSSLGFKFRKSVFLLEYLKEKAGGNKRS